MTQRLRLTFSATGPLRYVAHLDMMRTWERAIRRAGLPLSYSHGFSPHARLHLAAPLPVGVVGYREHLDLWLDRALPPEEVRERLNRAMPPGLEVVAAEEVADSLPSLQSSLDSARYEVAVPDVDVETLRAKAEALLARETVEWEEERGEKTRRYDLRAGILDLSVRDEPHAPVLELHLSLEEGRTGRPAQVLLAMGIDPEPLEVARTEVRLKQPAAASAGPERGAP
jgi:radical SAM-linked protein